MHSLTTLMGFQVLSCLTHKNWYDENAMSKGLHLGALSMSWELLLWNTKKKCYYGNLKKIYRVSKETTTKTAKHGEKPNGLLFSVYICMEYFLPGEGPPNNWEGMHLSLSLKSAEQEGK